MLLFKENTAGHIVVFPILQNLAIATIPDSNFAKQNKKAKICAPFCQDE